jgi:hypothetical protein
MRRGDDARVTYQRPGQLLKSASRKALLTKTFWSRLVDFYGRFAPMTSPAARTMTQRSAADYFNLGASSPH